ncbi:inner membrane complex protein 1k, putative [Plasmodium knowlesi strain H]|uniref:Inner membrane complex protein 1k, putative n=3 Tax=Plasmodium knowlesi TaxID=5850 RepID=A0A5K1VQM7_PLAKH|nr:inner membrane complex protein 1k, putative [Plasmodium knowlesi strain H]OTN66426.1 putative Inner membrane complex protein 1k [Plasmodium knowlesi]CAA9989921.1 inner membrane complex protein 1k, putative [Plasmodium knowlesi strain H]SBO24493.1 inner membrane complex protein 1k, putative [Plasmodium knowlesi strain H]SBO26464.1 inner membrane complex protein 1k, putative [Plasmodium knowlesi strain H]VVS79395.1 inner membrane complex protein 1k, putative [Plasmodium knowlesi strain H]|eukprot:XP_002259937.1 hypothetical protein, conserved in Plasmodium species [Plasmodium knowlesi strain H]
MNHNSGKNTDPSTERSDNSVGDYIHGRGIPSGDYIHEGQDQNAEGVGITELSENEFTGAQYIPELHGLGRPRQALPFEVNEMRIPGQVSPYHMPQDDTSSEKETLYDENGLPIRTNSNEQESDKKLWSWTNDGKLKLLCSQPIIPVSVVQGILRRDKIILIPQVEVTDFVVPKIYNQNIKHDVPKLDLKVKCSNVEIPNVKYVEKEIIIPIITGYTHKFIPKWDVHEVPRPVVKYIGEQKIVEVEVPEIKYIDKIVEREVVVDTVQKRVPKIIEVPKYVDEVKYVWKPIEKIVYIQKLVPKFDVNLECPPPLIVPYPVQTVKQIPPVMIRKDVKFPDCDYTDFNSPSGSLPVPREYVDYYTSRQKPPKGIFSNCCESNCKNGENHDETYYDVSRNCAMGGSEESIQNELNICNSSNPFVNTSVDSILNKGSSKLPLDADINASVSVMT